MRSVQPDLTPGQVDQLLASGTITEDLGAPGRDDNYGHGLIDALKAVRQAGGDTLPEPAPLLAVNPTSLNFGLVNAAVEVTAGNAGEGSLTGVDVQEPAEDWLTVQRPGTGDGLGVYRVQVLREGLAEGLYTATLHFVSAANAVDVPVIMQVVDPATTAIDAEGNAGLHFIGLYAPGATFPVDSIAVEAEDGRYDFDLNDVPAGQYELFAGTDLDNDGFICDGGEACAAYPTLDQPGTITVNGDLEGLEFVTGFAFAGSAAADASNGEAPAGNARAHDRGRR
jgi:serine protease